MSRAALAALRALNIIDLLAGQPAERFTLSDIVRLTETNAASCHAILAVMVQRGYLLRDPDRKTYRLAPSIVAIGEAAARHDPLLERARAAAAAQARRTGFETLLTARAGSDIVAVARFSGAHGSPVSLRVGQRVPLAAPLGGLFFAWEPGALADEWCAPAGQDVPDQVQAAHHAALALLRERGFLVSLRSAEHGAFTRRLAGADGDTHAARLTMLLHAMDNGLYQPLEILPDRDYRVRTVSAPIFDRFGRVLYNIALSFPDALVGGASLLDHAERLIEACSEASAAALPVTTKQAAG